MSKSDPACQGCGHSKSQHKDKGFGKGCLHRGNPGLNAQGNAVSQGCPCEQIVPKKTKKH